MQSLVFTFRGLYVVLFLHYKVQICKCVFEIRHYHPGIMKRKWKSSKCFILGDPSVMVLTAAVVFQVACKLPLLLKVSEAVAQLLTNLLPLSPLIEQSREEKALHTGAVPAGRKWVLCFPSRSSVLHRSCSWWLRPALCMDAAGRAWGCVATGMSTYHRHAVSAGLIVGCLSKREIRRAGCKYFSLLSSFLSSFGRREALNKACGASPPLSACFISRN